MFARPIGPLQRQCHLAQQFHHHSNMLYEQYGDLNTLTDHLMA